MTKTPAPQTTDALPPLRLLAEWHKPAGKTPLLKKPNTYKTISAAVAEIERLRRAIVGAQTAFCDEHPDAAMRILVETGVQNAR